MSPAFRVLIGTRVAVRETLELRNRTLPSAIATLQPFAW